MTTMVEQVAAAIFKALAERGIIAINWDTGVALAAIMAMREPTLDMVRAGAKELEVSGGQPFHEVQDAYLAMIKVALGEGETS